MIHAWFLDMRRICQGNFEQADVRIQPAFRECVRTHSELAGWNDCAKSSPAGAAFVLARAEAQGKVGKVTGVPLGTAQVSQTVFRPCCKYSGASVPKQRILALPKKMLISPATSQEIQGLCALELPADGSKMEAVFRGEGKGAASHETALHWHSLSRAHWRSHAGECASDGPAAGAGCECIARCVGRQSRQHGSYPARRYLGIRLRAREHAGAYQGQCKRRIRGAWDLHAGARWAHQP